MLPDQFLMKVSNVMLRVTSLAAKLILTLYMGRYLGLSDMGIYGLAFSAIMLATAALGVRLDYVVAREIVGSKVSEVLRLLRDQTVFLCCNYAFFAIVMIALTLAGVADPLLMLLIFIISALESLAHNHTTNLTSMGQPVLATFLFFIRAGLWCLVVAALGILEPSYRTVEVVLGAWAVGEVVSLLLNVWAWRKMPWKSISHLPIDWAWIWASVKRSMPIWLGTVGAGAAFAVDRYVVEYYMDLEKVGIITFYGSFAFALSSLAQSGFYAFSYPKMIKYHRSKDTKAFWVETRQVGWQALLFAMVIGLCVGLIIPFSAPFFQKPEFAEESLTLWLMLIAVCIRVAADTPYYVLYARGQDRPVWTGGLLFLVPTLLGNLILVPRLGLEGAGYSAIIAAIFLLIWRYWHVNSDK